MRHSRRREADASRALFKSGQRAICLGWQRRLLASFKCPPELKKLLKKQPTHSKSELLAFHCARQVDYSRMPVRENSATVTGAMIDAFSLPVRAIGTLASGLSTGESNRVSLGRRRGALSLAEPARQKTGAPRRNGRLSGESCALRGPFVVPGYPLRNGAGSTTVLRAVYMRGGHASVQGSQPARCGR